MIDSASAGALGPPEPARYVVGIGASAGGLQALEEFFANVPSDPGMAFVVVQHLSPDFKSVMDELLARRTTLPILHAEDGMQVLPGRIYLNPPKQDMIISDGRLLLSDRDRQQSLSLPIDQFFRSLAQDRGPDAIAVILSGSGSDGSRGVRDIRESGGLVIVQDIKTAQFDGMPRTAIDSGVANSVLAPGEMPSALVDHLRQRSTALEPGAIRPDGNGLSDIYRVLEQEFGIDFTHYKPSTVTRRIERRLELSRSGDLEGYIDRLRNGREELDTLYRDLLIGVTRFFRNDAAFALLEERILPEQLGKAPKDEPFRVWVAGCATGEEAYSLAMILHELSVRQGGRPIKIFATDVHRASIETAARGVYPESALGGISRERLERYFRRQGSAYQVIPDLRQMIVFATHNLLKDAPFTHVDLVTCRNLLIYFQAPAQQKALSHFHFALNRGGLVFLGPSESPGPIAREFETVDAHWRIYRKVTDARMMFDQRLQPRVSERGFPSIPAVSSDRSSLAHLLTTYDALLEEALPPSFLVTDRGELVHTFGGASKFLRSRDGRQRLDVMDMVDPELKLVLVGGLQRARKERAAIVFTRVRIAVNEHTSPYRVTIRPIAGRNGMTPHLLVSIESMEVAPDAKAEGETPREVDVETESRVQLGTLELELSHTKENLQAAIEELETSNEELQAANEELIASNEELQSTNEELQSVNEELYTVNAEYQRKIGELTDLTNDVDNLLASTEIGTIFLDSLLKIRKFTPQIADNFNLMPHDVGRSIESFTHNMEHPKLGEDLRQVLRTKEPVERELRQDNGQTYFLRILPYRAKGIVDGVVLTLVNVTGLKTAEDALFHERYLLNSLLATLPDAIYFKDASGKLLRANPAMAARLGVDDPKDAVGKTPLDLPNRAEALTMHQEDERLLAGGNVEPYISEQRTRADGTTEWDLVTRLPLTDGAGTIVGIIGIFRDVTEQHVAGDRLREAVRLRDQFLAMLSHELRNPLNAITSAVALLKLGDVERERVLKILDRQSQQMARLLDDLLEASRVTQNKIELRRKVLDLRSVVNETAEAARGLMNARGVAFSVTVDERAIPVDGDPARLQQIQMNLLSNAAKYTPRGGRVTLDVKRENGSAVVVVRDDGVGIPVEISERIFDLFVQSRRTLARAEGGLGVGLTLVRALVTLHGGTVSMESAGEGKGSEFVIRLPLAVGPLSGTSMTDGQSPFGLVKGARVVVVEDNEDSRDLLCTILESAGLECHTASDGLEGLALVERVRPEVAILDVGLPGMDGFELARKLREGATTATIRLVALTGYGQPQDRAAALAAGFDRHVVKPVIPDDLVELLMGQVHATEADNSLTQ